MWTVIKFEKKQINFLREDLTKKLGSNYKIYIPKIKIQKYKKNKLISKEVSVLGDYMFCFHKQFNSRLTIEALKFVRGLKYFLTGHNDSQDDIENFIKRCSKLEDKNGYISKDLFELEINKSYKFSSGPFTDKIFKLINLQRDILKISMGNLSTSINRKKYLFTPL